MQSAILFYHFCLSVGPKTVLCRQDSTYRETFSRSGVTITVVVPDYIELRNSNGKGPVTQMDFRKIRNFQSENA